MKFSKYLKDNLYFIVPFIFSFVLILLLLLAFKVNTPLIIVISLILFILLITIILIGYFRKKRFYDDFIQNLERLDKKYLILETISNPNFYDGELFYNALYEINKSMSENVKIYEDNVRDFKDYIEMWIHEIKIPVSSLVLMAHNHKDTIDKKCMKEIKKIEKYIEQVLYYVRSENAEKDYLIKESDLSKIISNVALKNKDDILEKNITFEVKDVKAKVLTDSKWLEFIINQIVNNSVKYIDEEKQENIIKIYTEKNSKTTTLVIYDNGIGISSNDVSRVFDKSFTGENGRIFSKATGMGLYIAKKLCLKLGHKIRIDSKQKEYTKVSITFANNKFYKF